MDLGLDFMKVDTFVVYCSYFLLKLIIFSNLFNIYDKLQYSILFSILLPKSRSLLKSSQIRKSAQTKAN